MTPKQQVLKKYSKAYIKSWFDENGEWRYCVMLGDKCLGEASQFISSAWQSAAIKIH